MAVLPLELQGRVAGRDILVDPVEQRADGIVGAGIGPVRGEDVIGLAPEQKVEGLGEHLAHRLLHRRVEIGAGPSAMLEAADGIFLRPSRRLHDAVETRERRSEEHTSELQSLMRISYAVFCLKKKI